MYEYAPRSPKSREKRLFLVCLAPALLLLLLSLLPQTPVPHLCRLLGVCMAVASAWIASRYLLRRYSYRVAPREDGVDSLDLTVTEIYGRRRRVVCRISLADIEAVARENREKQNTRVGAERYFQYTDVIDSSFFCLLTVRDGNLLCRIRLMADDTLYHILQNHR